MDTPKARLQTALKQAMVDKDTVRRDVIRMTMSAIKQVEIDSRKELSADEMLAILQKEAKTRRETIEEQLGAGRQEAAAEGERELAILMEFLPQQLSEAEVTALVQAAIEQSGAASAKDTGKVMALVMPQVKGKADGSLVSRVVRELLSQLS